jgi:hypothetical protein
MLTITREIDFYLNRLDEETVRCPT